MYYLAIFIPAAMDSAAKFVYNSSRKEPTNMINTVLFDFDGTIMDTNDVIIQSWQTTFRALEGREEDVDTLLRTFGEPLEKTMRDFFPSHPLEQALEIYRGYQRDNFLSDIHLFPGIRELLEELSGRQIRMALVTSRLKSTTMQALDAFDLRKYFRFVVTADDVTRHKPDPQSIEIALDHLGSKPEDTIMVGDSPFDIHCARNAGVKPVLVSWSVTLAKQLQEGLPPEQTPDAIIDDPMQLLQLM
ncbi:MAG: HAD-IA family hydrolase [Firmicutes bacterium]|nr:HAD-IA family hydrolase [Bacillota bacterium]